MSTPGNRIVKRPWNLRRWLSAIDPGLIRLESAGRAALTLLSIWLVIRYVVQPLSGASGPPIALLGVVSGIIFLLFIIDLRPADRKLTLALATIPFAGAVLLASFLSSNFWLSNLILLSLFFFAYFFRRYGPRAGELALVTTVGFYLGFLLRIPQKLYPLFLVCVGLSALIIFVWQFVILPYDPVKSLQRSVIAYYHHVAQTVATAAQGLQPASGNAGDHKRMQRLFRGVHSTRRLIEGQFSAAVSPVLWSQGRLNRLQDEMFKTERGLELLIEAAGVLSDQRKEIPADVLQTLTEGFAALEELLWDIASSSGQARLSEAGDLLQVQLKSSLQRGSSGAWAPALLRLGAGGRQLARSVEALRAIEIAWDEAASNEHSQKPVSASPKPPSQVPAPKEKIRLHPTTILGLQAVLATGLAMAAAFLLDLDQPNLVYWTAFVVIAGSTGESLRRMTLRVFGVVAGTLIGVALAVLLPENLPLTVVLVAICLFLTVYSITISYLWMIFWLNIGILLIITALGGSALDLVVVRPVSTLLGAGIAALVVVFVLPIHVQNRFAGALAEFLAAVDRYIAAYIRTLIEPSPSDDLSLAALDLDTSYKKLELNLPNVIYEYNPLSRAQSGLAGQATSLAVLKGYVTHLEDDVGGEPGIGSGLQNDGPILTIQTLLHDNLAALTGFLAGGQDAGLRPLDGMAIQAKAEITLEQVIEAESGSAEAVHIRAVYHLARIHDTILQIASGLGAPVSSSAGQVG